MADAMVRGIRVQASHRLLTFDEAAKSKWVRKRLQKQGEENGSVFVSSRGPESGQSDKPNYHFNPANTK